MNKAIPSKYGTIRQRSENGSSYSIVVYAVDPVTKVGKRIWETFKRGDGETDARLKARCEDRLRQLATAKHAGADITPQRETLGAYLTKWLDTYESDHQGSRTPLTYRSLMNLYVIPTIGHIQLTKLTVDDVESMLRTMRDKPVSARTRHHANAVLSTALRKAIKDERLTRNVAAYTDANLRTASTKRLDPPTIEQGKRLIARARTTEIGTLIQLLALTGLRIGEALGLRWQDVDLDAGVLQVRQVFKSRVSGAESFVYGEPKTEASAAMVPLVPAVVESLREHRRLQLANYLETGLRPGHDLVFTRDDGKPMTDARVRRVWESVRRAEKLPTARIHDWRHFTGTYLKSEGVDLNIVSAILRHANIGITANVYVTPDKAAMREGLERLENVVIN